MSQEERYIVSESDRPVADTQAFSAEPEVVFSPEIAGRYKPIKELGTGAQGKVFLAERIADKKRVAIKQLRIDSIKTWKEYTLFHREAETLAGLDIPGVVKFYEACDCLEDNPPCSYIVQEYVEGTTLKERLASGHRFSLSEVYDLTLQLLDILEKLHTHAPPIIHRDIKPSNIILRTTDNGGYEVCLIDFGAVANPQVQSGGSTVAGTYGYMAPEQTIGRAEPQSDIYALGALVAYMLSGVEPAEMKTQNLRLIIDPYLENHPVALVQTLRRMLEPSIQDRLADYKELKNRFHNFKNNIYTLENETHAPFSKKEFKKRLKDVRCLCQPQNLEIWQNLPDMPQNRLKLPFCIKTRPRFRKYPILFDKSRAEFLASWVATVNICCTCAIIVWGLLLWMGSKAASPERLMVMLTIAILIFIVSNNLPIGEVRAAYEFGTRWGLSPIKQVCVVKGKRCSIHELIYRTGRKTIATITEIQYVPASHYYESSGNGKRICCLPDFKVSYKFNPPDDDLEEDVVHTMIIHRDPEGLFKVGDPLPILYICDGNGKTLHVTESMPYPFPLGDLEWFYDYIGKGETDIWNWDWQLNNREAYYHWKRN